jgi:hypothetical protein
LSIANHTPRLNLMRPVDSDLFDPADYTATFDILDLQPGVRPVANYAALTALSWGIPQHGSRAIQMDNLAEWMWYNPSGSGTWKRTNSVGLIKQVLQTSDVSSSATSGSGPLVVTTGNVTAPGIRPLHVNLDIAVDNTTGSNGLCDITLTDNGTTLRQWTVRATAPVGTSGLSHLFDWWVLAPAVGSSHNFSVYIRSIPGSSANGANGTSTARRAALTIIEG